MAKPKLNLGTIGQTGLPVWSGRVYDEMLRDLEGERGRKVFREMSEQDPIIGGTMLGIEMVARQVSWSIKPADKSDQAKEVADFIDSALSDMSPTFGSTLSEILSFLVYGWSWLEILYKKRKGLDFNDPMKNSMFEDGKIGWGGWSIRGQESLFTWKFDGLNGDVGNVTHMVQNPPPNYPMIPVPRSKSLHFKTKSRKENPEGISILRNAYRSWYLKNNIEVIEGIGVERDLAGLPVLSAPEILFSEDASDGEKALFAQLQKLVTAIKRDEQEGVLLPMAFDEAGNPTYKLELLSTGGDRQFDTSAIISRYDARMAMSMLADFILMGHEAVGSFALSATKTGLFSTAMSAFLDIVVEEINSRAFPMLVVLNGWPLKMCPTLQHGKVEAADMGKLGDFLKQLAGAGMQVFPNKTLETYLLESAGLPGTEEIEEAGELPAGEVTIDPATGNVIPLVVPPGTPQPAGVKATNPAARSTARPSEPTPATRARPSRDLERQQETARAAGEKKGKQKHFIPLPVRISRIQAKLAESMSFGDYTALLADAMTTGKFSKLDREHQLQILFAEQESVQNAD